ncbi:MAG: hypothetical protein ACLFQM_10445 [Fidelibacterota bacterium]
MKIGEVIEKINKQLSEQSEGYSYRDFISASKINAYRKMGLIKPPLKKKKNCAYYDYKEIHFQLIFNAYKKIVINRMRTRDAFEKTYEELSHPSLF